MLSILYILHHCNMLQRLGGNFPHHALVRWGHPLPCLLQTRWYSTQPPRAAQGPGMLCQAAGWQPNGAAPFLLPITCSASPAWGEGRQGIAAAAVHVTKLFLIQRGPELHFPLWAIPIIVSKASAAGDNTSTGIPPLASAPSLNLSRTVP